MLSSLSVNAKSDCRRCRPRSDRGLNGFWCRASRLRDSAIAVWMDADKRSRAAVWVVSECNKILGA